MPRGFIGLGLMGQPMAANLAGSGLDLLVWNRTQAKLEPALAAGAKAAAGSEEVFARCETIVLMLATSEAIDAVLGRGEAAFEERVQNRLIINTGTVSPRYSSELASEIRSVGGRYVEAPVSGSRQQAQERRLVAMLSGEGTDVAAARALLGPICRATFECGPVPGALRAKLAVNLFMIVMVSGLVEAFHFAERAGVNPVVLRDILAASPMASNVSQVKAEKLAAGDWLPQAAIADVLKNVEFIREATATAGAVSPLMRTCRELYAEAVMQGEGESDMVAVADVLRRRAEMAQGC